MRPNLHLHLHLLIFPILPILLLLTTHLTTPTSAQADFMFAYYLPNTKCRAHVPPGSGKSQAIPTTADGQCVPVNNALQGSFDVSISAKVYWTNGDTPAIKACPTVDCDIYPDNGCFELWGPKQWPGTEICKHMVGTYYWAVGPMGFNLKERQAGEGEAYNGSYSNVTEPGIEWTA